MHLLKIEYFIKMPHFSHNTRTRNGNRKLYSVKKEENFDTEMLFNEWFLGLV